LLFFGGICAPFMGRGKHHGRGSRGGADKAGPGGPPVKGGRLFFFFCPFSGGRREIFRVLETRRGRDFPEWGGGGGPRETKKKAPWIHPTRSFGFFGRGGCRGGNVSDLLLQGLWGSGGGHPWMNDLFSFRNVGGVGPFFRWKTTRFLGGGAINKSGRPNEGFRGRFSDFPTGGQAVNHKKKQKPFKQRPIFCF